MRNTLIFSGTSCPGLTAKICENLGMAPADADLTQFSNGETSVRILTSVREKDVFVVQSGSARINDTIMELLIMISACKGGSANKITAVLPYFPYSRQSKKKSHRGAITARMLANLLHIAGVKHVITVDLHASQMQGFFKCPVDNLHAEPLFARWIRHEVPNWKEAVVVSKNAGGTKRVTSLADALKLNFGMVTTDRKRSGNMSASMIMSHLDGYQRQPILESTPHPLPTPGSASASALPPPAYGGGGNAQGDGRDSTHRHTRTISDDPIMEEAPAAPAPPRSRISANPHGSPVRTTAPATCAPFVPLSSSSASRPQASNRATFARAPVPPSEPPASIAETEEEQEGEGGQKDVGRDVERDGEDDLTQQTPPATDELQYNDRRVEVDEVTHGRLIQGHIVPDDFPSPTTSAADTSIPEEDPMVMSHASSFFAPEPHALGGSGGAGPTSDDEEDTLKNPKVEHMITLVGDVKNRTVLMIDDMIDKPGSWIAAAETVYKRGLAKKVYCIATHAVFGGDCLEQLQACECIDQIVVTNSFPIDEDKAKNASKLIILDLSYLLSEAIRRNHYGESIHPLFQHMEQ